ncbi:hypothetical protein ONZ45_g152 [Pleurotus djamor]|nr:hypothetical protein ONZ45_g152 [Pleurotus djamor]
MAFLTVALVALAFTAAAQAAGDKAQNKAAAVTKAVGDICFGEGNTPFFQPVMLDLNETVESCCPPPLGITWFDEAKRIGECCPPGQKWSGDQATVVGGCCATEKAWSQDKVSGLGGCCAPGLSFKGDKASKKGDCCAAGLIWLNGKCAPPPPRPTCKDLADPVCASDTDLGIKYGHCYVLKFSDGTQLGGDHAAPTYSKNGFFRDIPFKVCKTTTDCSLGDAVPTDGSWFLQDQMGRPQDAAGTVGWIDNGFNGTHIKFNTNAAQAGLFKGTPVCSDGKCFLKLRGGPTGNGGIGATCPVDTHGITFWPNSKVTLDISFTETACSGPDAPFAPVDAPTAGLLAASVSQSSIPAVSSLVSAAKVAAATGKAARRGL